MEKKLIIILLMFFSSWSFSQQILKQNTKVDNTYSAPTEEQINQTVLSETQNQLTNPEKRNELFKKNPQAQRVDNQVKDLMGKNSEDFYRTASDFLPFILKIGQGDPKKMAEYLNQIARDPASFANSLPTDLKQKITVITQKAKPLPEERKP
jgi:hypothetical protein